VSSIVEQNHLTFSTRKFFLFFLAGPVSSIGGAPKGLIRNMRAGNGRPQVGVVYARVLCVCVA
jgi:hypothetical protein